MDSDLRVGRAIVKAGHQIAGDFVKLPLGRCLEIYWFTLAADIPGPLGTAADEDAGSVRAKLLVTQSRASCRTRNPALCARLPTHSKRVNGCARRHGRRVAPAPHHRCRRRKPCASSPRGRRDLRPVRRYRQAVEAATGRSLAPPVAMPRRRSRPAPRGAGRTGRWSRFARCRV